MQIYMYLHGMQNVYSFQNGDFFTTEFGIMEQNFAFLKSSTRVWQTKSVLMHNIIQAKFPSTFSCRPWEPHHDKVAQVEFSRPAMCFSIV